MAETNLAQHEQHLKLLEASIKEIDRSCQKMVNSRKKMDDGLHEISNLIFKLYLIAHDLREIYLQQS